MEKMLLPCFFLSNMSTSLCEVNLHIKSAGEREVDESELNWSKKNEILNRQKHKKGHF